MRIYVNRIDPFGRNQVLSASMTFVYTVAVKQFKINKIISEEKKSAESNFVLQCLHDIIYQNSLNISSVHSV